MRFCAAAILLVTAAQSATSVSNSANAETTHNPAMAGPAGFREFAADFERLTAQEARIRSIGWRLIAGNASICPDTRPDLGLTFDDAGGYNRPEWVRRIVGNGGDLFVQTVANPSPASASAVPPHDQIVKVEGEMLDTANLPEPPGWQRLRALETLIERSLADGSASLTFARGGTFEIPAQTVCNARFEIIPDRKGAYADGQRVRIGRNFPPLSYPDDELGAALAHELAHNLLAHPQWLAVHDLKKRDVRATEREADRLAIWLLANAGYDPTAMIRLLQRWGPRHSGGLFRKRTHDSWRKRIRLVQAELIELEQAMLPEGTADWSSRFTRYRVPVIPAETTENSSR